MMKPETAGSKAFDALESLLADWRISLRASGRSPATIASYLTVGESFAAYLSSHGLSTEAGAITREEVEQYLAGMRDRGLSPATVAKHYRSLQQLFKWLTDDGEIDRSPMERMSPPSVPEQPVPILGDAALAALLGTVRATLSRTVGTPPSSGCCSTPGCVQGNSAASEPRTWTSITR